MKTSYAKSDDKNTLGAEHMNVPTVDPEMEGNVKQLPLKSRFIMASVN